MKLGPDLQIADPRFGSFNEHDAFVIRNPHTPTPWVNVISNGRYGLVISQRGGGFSWLDNSQLNVLTRWEMDLVRDAHGKFLYLADIGGGEHNGRVWSIAPAPCGRDYERFECEHAPGRTTFRSSAHGIDAEWTLSVAPEDPVEIWVVTLTNTSARTRTLRVCSYLEWCCGVAPDVKREFHKLFIDTSYDDERHAVLATKNMWDIPDRDERDHWNRPWPYVAAHACVGVERRGRVAFGDKREFLGTYADPAGLALADKRFAGTGSFGRFGDAVAAVGGAVSIEPGQTACLAFVTAIDSNRRSTEALLDRYLDLEACSAAIEGTARGWRGRLGATGVETDARDFDLLNNTWLPYQAISARLWGRTGYYQQSGAFGFRDQLQDSQVWLPRDPARCREQILLHAAHQFADGSVYHWWHPLAEFGLRTECSDDYLWLPFITAAYVGETGDVGVLDEVMAFVDDDTGVSLLEHCDRAIGRTLSRLSPRGLPLIGSCDWNDGLSACGVGERGESVWLAFFFAEVLDRRARLARAVNDAAGAERFEAGRRRVLDAANEHAWDGRWFRRATTDSGRWLGARENSAGRMYLNPQTWAILTDGAPADRLDACWESVREQLLRDMGPLLLAPAYSEPDPEIGYITRYAPGLRENGGVYMHAATWALAAACKRRDRDAVERIYNSISPPRRAADAHAYAAEPYVMPGNVDGPLSAMPGRAGWTWYTGSAAWFNRVCLEWVLGVRPGWDGLTIDPCPMRDLGRVTLRRAWRGRTVVVRFDAADWRRDARAKLVVNGRVVQTDTIRAQDSRPGDTIEVQVRWGVTPERRTPTGVAERSAV